MNNNQKRQIPKVIHYCWFGKGKYKKEIRECIATWKKHLKDYKFILWNEENFSSEIPFYKHAYQNEKWAYVSDYVRLKVLYEQGGIYLDTDMFFIKTLDSRFLQHSSFFGVENPNLISCGIIGAIPKNNFIGKCLNYYESMVDVEKTVFKLPITKIITNLFRKEYGFYNQFDKPLSFDGIVIYPPDYFYPYPFNINKKLDKNFENYATQNSVAIHLWNGSWHNYNEFHYFRRGQYFKGFVKMINSITKEKFISISYWKKIINALKKSFQK